MQKGEKTRIMLPRRADDSVKQFETPQSTAVSGYKSKESKKMKSKDAVTAYRGSLPAEIVAREPHARIISSKKGDGASSGSEETAEERQSGRERLKRHRMEVAGRVWIPEMWGQEDLLKDWIDCTAFDSILANSSIVSARESLMEEGRKANSSRFGIENSC